MIADVLAPLKLGKLFLGSAEQEGSTKLRNPQLSYYQRARFR